MQCLLCCLFLCFLFLCNFFTFIIIVLTHLQENILFYFILFYWSSGIPHTLSLAIDVTNAPWTDELPVNKHVRANSAPRPWPLAAPKRPRPLRCCDLSAIISSLHSASGRPLLASNAPAVFQSMLCCFSSHFQNVHRRQPSGRPLLNTLSTAQSFHNHAQHTIFITDYWPGRQRLCGTSRWHQVRGEREGERE